MNKQLPGFARRILIILFWIILWQFAASLIRNHIFLVGPVDTLRALCGHFFRLSGPPSCFPSGGSVSDFSLPFSSGSSLGPWRTVFPSFPNF